jgi:hypothetical protein
MKRIYRKKNKTALPPTTTQEYINNCIYWIKEYEAGNVDIEKCLSASNNLSAHLHKLIAEQQQLNSTTL